MTTIIVLVISLVAFGFSITFFCLGRRLTGARLFLLQAVVLSWMEAAATDSLGPALFGLAVLGLIVKLGDWLDDGRQQTDEQ
ncbi:hypothetical protein [Duganella sp. LjRoot269]|uniref:hypothetical protein n=1 Tax=Duganella sp. LjRoot269 TaxID=3342305 RepID=UPI003ED0F411